MKGSTPGMKKKRHEEVLRLIEKYPISTQEELQAKLNERGFDVTQATVSRDIKTLKIVKATTADGSYRYVTTRTQPDALVDKFKSIFTQSVIKADSAGNTVVIKCYNGMAQAACAAFDGMSWDSLVGTLAGDDTIFALCRTEEAAEELKTAIQGLLMENL